MSSPGTYPVQPRLTAWSILDSSYILTLHVTFGILLTARLGTWEAYRWMSHRHMQTHPWGWQAFTTGDMLAHSTCWETQAPPRARQDLRCSQTRMNACLGLETASLMMVLSHTAGWGLRTLNTAAQEALWQQRAAASTHVMMASHAPEPPGSRPTLPWTPSMHPFARGTQSGCHLIWRSPRCATAPRHR